MAPSVVVDPRFTSPELESRISDNLFWIKIYMCQLLHNQRYGKDRDAIPVDFCSFFAGEHLQTPATPIPEIDRSRKKGLQVSVPLDQDEDLAKTLGEEKVILSLGNFVEQVEGQIQEILMVESSTENPKMELHRDDFRLLKQTQVHFELIPNMVSEVTRLSDCKRARKNLGVRMILVKRRYHRARKKKSTNYTPRPDLVQALKCYDMFRVSVFRDCLDDHKVERAHFKGTRSMVDTGKRDSHLFGYESQSGDPINPLIHDDLMIEEAEIDFMVWNKDVKVAEIPEPEHSNIEDDGGMCGEPSYGADNIRKLDHEYERATNHRVSKVMVFPTVAHPLGEKAVMEFGMSQIPRLRDDKADRVWEPGGNLAEKEFLVGSENEKCADAYLLEFNKIFGNNWRERASMIHQFLEICSDGAQWVKKVEAPPQNIAGKRPRDPGRFSKLNRSEVQSEQRKMQDLESEHQRGISKPPLSYGADWENLIEWENVHLSENRSKDMVTAEVLMQAKFFNGHFKRALHMSLKIGLLRSPGELVVQLFESFASIHLEDKVCPWGASKGIGRRGVSITVKKKSRPNEYEKKNESNSLEAVIVFLGLKRWWCFFQGEEKRDVPTLLLVKVLGFTIGHATFYRKRFMGSGWILGIRALVSTRWKSLTDQSHASKSSPVLGMFSLKEVVEDQTQNTITTRSEAGVQYIYNLFCELQRKSGREKANLEDFHGGLLTEFFKRKEARIDDFKGANVVTSAVEHCENPLASVLNFEMFSSPRPPELSSSALGFCFRFCFWYPMGWLVQFGFNEIMKGREMQGALNQAEKNSCGSKELMESDMEVVSSSEKKTMVSSSNLADKWLKHLVFKNDNKVGFVIKVDLFDKEPKRFKDATNRVNCVKSTTSHSANYLIGVLIYKVFHFSRPPKLLGIEVQVQAGYIEDQKRVKDDVDLRYELFHLQHFKSLQALSSTLRTRLFFEKGVLIRSSIKKLGRVGPPLFLF